MADIANLIIRADFQNNASAGLKTLGTEVRKAANNVNSLNASLQNTKGILDRTSVSKVKASSEAVKLAKAEQQAASGARAVEKGARGANRALEGTAGASNRASVAVTRFGRNTRNTASNLRDIAVIGAVIGLSLGSAQRAVRRASAASVEFGEALSEVATITGDSTASLGVLRTVAEEFSASFGGTTTEQVRAFYQAYSAGASNAAEASVIVSTANQLAVGGVASLDSAVGLLSSTLNAYSLEGLSAANASDLLFIAVRNGVTTISQLAQSLSRVTGTAANFGVAFGTVTAAIASITGTGAPTAQATTQVNALVLGLQRLTPEARAFATSIGITSTAPRDFVQVIRQLNGVLRGVDNQLERTSIIFRLFGTEVNALRAVASLTGGGFETFNRTLLDNEMAVGATDTAYNKLHDTLAGRLMRAYGDLSASQVRLGDELNRAIVPAIESFSQAVSVITKNIPILGGVVTALAAGALLSLVRRVVALAIATTVATGGLNLLTAGVTALGAALVGTVAYGFLEFNSATNQTRLSFDELTTAQQNFTKAVMSGDAQLIASARQQIRILRAQANAEAEELRDRIARGASIGGIEIREGTPVRRFTNFLGLTSANEDLVEAEFLLAKVEGRIERFDTLLGTVVLNPDLLTDAMELDRTFESLVQRGSELRTEASTAFTNETALERFARETREFNERIDADIADRRGRLAGLREVNGADGGFLTSDAELQAQEKAITDLDEFRNQVNIDRNAAYLLGVADRNEKEFRARMALEARILAEVLANDRRREAERARVAREAQNAIDQRNAAISANIGAGVGIATGDFNASNATTLLGNFADRLSMADGAVGVFGSELLKAVPGIGQFLQIAQAIPGIVGQRTITGESFVGNFRGGDFTDGVRLETNRESGLIGLARQAQTGSRSRTDELDLNATQIQQFRLGATQSSVALREFFDIVGEGHGAFDVAGSTFEEALDGIQDGLAGTVDNLSGVANAGEEASSALARVAGSFRESNDALLRSGFGGLSSAVLSGGAFSRAGSIAGIADTLSLRTTAEQERLTREEFSRRIAGTGQPGGATAFDTNEEFLALIDTLTDALRAQEVIATNDAFEARQRFAVRRFDPAVFAGANPEEVNNRLLALEAQRDREVLEASASLDPFINRLQSALEAQDEFETLFGGGRTPLNLGSSGFATEADQRLAQAIRSDADPNQSIIDKIQILIDSNNGNFGGLITAFEDSTSATEFLNSQA